MGILNSWSSLARAVAPRMMQRRDALIALRAEDMTRLELRA